MKSLTLTFALIGTLCLLVGTAESQNDSKLTESPITVTPRPNKTVQATTAPRTTTIQPTTAPGTIKPVTLNLTIAKPSLYWGRNWLYNHWYNGLHHWGHRWGHFWGHWTHWRPWSHWGGHGWWHHRHPLWCHRHRLLATRDEVKDEVETDINDADNVDMPVPEMSDYDDSYPRRSNDDDRNE
uniref:Uncharacterized LOC100183924 n=1 Tax=Ciona intestinalis TaxID=7719 RepID=F6SEE3_CIOIN|nr:uncharacterized protein LOC100183924 [Ciona intestinalis]|eukprot:XP_002129086.1 uncharacterized protein LOC100183924 [Ciona intestinalis]